MATLLDRLASRGIIPRHRADAASCSSLPPVLACVPTPLRSRVEESQPVEKVISCNELETIQDVISTSPLDDNDETSAGSEENETTTTTTNDNDNDETSPCFKRIGGQRSDNLTYKRQRTEATAPSAGRVHYIAPHAEIRQAKFGRAETTIMVEALAKSYVESGRFTAKALNKALQLFESLIPYSSSRPNIHQAGVAAVQSMLLGLYSYAAEVDVTSKTRNFPWMTRLLCGFCRRQCQNFAFTSIQVNVNTESAPHVDSNNLGTSRLICFGEYWGGDLWVESPKGPDLHIVARSIRGKPQYAAGTEVKGKIRCVKERWVEFDGTKLHFTLPFKGRRTSLVFFVNSDYHRAANHCKAELTQLEFVLPA